MNPFRKSAWAAMIVAAAATGAARGEFSAELHDLVARIHYGYYHAEPEAIAVAQTALARVADDPLVTYFRDLAVLRRAQLGASDREIERALKACAERKVGAERKSRAAAEAWVLVAACGVVAGDGRARDALAAARRLDADHPRLLLVEAWLLERTGAADAALGEKKWAAVVAAFDSFTRGSDDPDWGEAEALTELARATVARGEVRPARDLLERALLVAPGYTAAVELHSTLQSRRSPGYTP